jgi:uncharacterized protein YycO
MENMMQFKRGQIVITEGNGKSIISRGIRIFSGSWWTHGFVVINEIEFVEASFPRVKVGKIGDRLNELERQGRAFVVLDYPGLSEEERDKVAAAASSYVGRVYDYGNFITYILFKLWYQGTKRLVCSSLMARAFETGLGIRIFDNLRLKLPKESHARVGNLKRGFCTPQDILNYSNLKIIHYHENF